MRGSKPGLFERNYGEGTFARLCSMLDDPVFNYSKIARSFGFTRQYVGQIAKKLGVDGRHRQRKRTLGSLWFSDHWGYPADVRAVAREIKRRGLKVLPYRPLRPSDGKLAPTRKRELIIDGVPCRIHCRRRARKTAPKGREYVMFPIIAKTKEADVEVFTFWRHGAIKLFVIPTRALRNVSTLWLPADGRYAENHLLKRQRR